jgi:multidrug efflux system membrane fusion protein
MIKRSYIWAAFFALAMAGWLASGELAPRLAANGDGKDQVEATTEERVDELFRVEVRRFKAQQRLDVITLQGRTEAYKTLDVLVRTPGIVEKSPRSEGERVKVGDLLCELDKSDREARLAQAKASLASAERDFKAAETLERKKFVSQAKLATEQARLDAARAVLEQMELDISWTRATAPIAGTIAERPTEEGSYLKVGEKCAQITVLDPILAIGQVGERFVSALKVGAPARFKLISGSELQGKIRFISPQADLATRTFRVEIEAANPDQSVRSGLTAELAVPLPAVTAHLLPASLISLDDAGIIGVHSVDENKAVEFLPVKILAQSRQGTWVSGLPDEVTLITTGQHYVLEGQTVEPIEQPGAGS